MNHSVNPHRLTLKRVLTEQFVAALTQGALTRRAGPGLWRNDHPRPPSRVSACSTIPADLGTLQGLERVKPRCGPGTTTNTPHQGKHTTSHTRGKLVYCHSRQAVAQQGKLVQSKQVDPSLVSPRSPSVPGSPSLMAAPGVTYGVRPVEPGAGEEGKHPGCESGLTALTHSLSVTYTATSSSSSSVPPPYFSISYF